MDKNIDNMKTLLKSQAQVINQKFLELGNAYRAYYSGLFFEPDTGNICTRNSDDTLDALNDIQKELNILIKQYQLSWKQYNDLVNESGDF